MPMNRSLLRIRGVNLILLFAAGFATGAVLVHVGFRISNHMSKANETKTTKNDQVLNISEPSEADEAGSGLLGVIDGQETSSVTELGEEQLDPKDSASAGMQAKVADDVEDEKAQSEKDGGGNETVAVEEARDGCNQESAVSSDRNWKDEMMFLEAAEREGLEAKKKRKPQYLLPLVTRDGGIMD